MGMSVGMGGRGGRGHRRRGRHHALMSEINVTPMVDVMLVLLIIFMVAAPMLTVGVPIDLPDTQAKAMNADTQPITVSINAAGQIYLQETEIPIEELVAKLQAIAGSKNTSLAVVAPGIAEALLATAIGLLAAIPAVIAYNKLSSDASKIAVRMEGFSDEFSAILSRQIDEKVAPKA